MSRNLGLEKKIRIKRLARGITQEEFASLIGVSYQTVSSWENGHSVPRDKNLEKIKAILGWSDQAEVAFGILAGDGTQ
jgi:transcriptional regulator with XRE-family HTH domain